MENEKPHRLYTVGEEIANSVTHGIGAVFGITATVLLIVFSAIDGDPWKIVSSSIYGATLILLYTMSTLYHSFTGPRVKAVFRIFDHCMIYLLIAGTYTPFTLVSLRGPLGWTLFGVVWGAAILGMVLSAISLTRFKVFSMICYIAMGWVVVFAAKPVAIALTGIGTALLIGGGIFYTGGVVFYGMRKRWFHSVWHLFVLAGSVCHFICIFAYVILK